MVVAFLCAGFAPLQAADALQAVEASEAPELEGTAEALVEGDAYTVTGQREATQLQLAKPSSVGSNLGIPLLDMPVSIDLIGAEAMRQRGYGSAHEAAASGVGMITYMEKNANPLFSSRGFFRDNVVVLRDGLRFDSQVESARPIDTFNLDRVEVIKGPSSLMTGLGAIGASVNFVSKKPLRAGSQVESLLGYDSFGRLRVGAAHSAGGAKMGYRLGAVHSGGSGYQDRTGQNNYDVALGLESQLLDKLGVDLFLDYQSTDIKGHNGIPTINNGLSGLQPFSGAELAPVALTNNYDVSDGFSRSQGLRGRIDLRLEIDERVSLRNTSYAYGSFQEERFTDRYHVQAGNAIVQVRLNDYRRWDNRQGNLTQLSLDLGTVDLRLRSALGVDFRHERVRRLDPFGTGTVINGVDLKTPGQIIGPAADYSAVPPANAKSVLSQKTTLYFEEHVDLYGRLQLLGGLSVDQFSIAYQPNASQPYGGTTYPGVLNGRAGVVLKALEGTSLYGSFTTAATPNYAPVNISAPNARFQLEKGRQWEGGFKASRWGGRLQGTVAYYLIEKTDLVSRSESIPGSGVYDVQGNVGKQSARGTELVLSLRPWGGLLLEGNYAHTQARFDSYRNNATNDRTGNTPSYVPVVQAGLNLRYQFEMGLGLGVQHRHVGDRFSDEDNRSQMPAYNLVDADLSYTWNRHTLTLRGRNLTDEKAIVSARTPSANTTEFKVAEPRALEAVYSSKF
jgi:iron complex outermembrane receptor protein